MYLQYFLYYGSVLAGTVALACAGLACWRLSKVLRERAFAVAAWAMGISVALDAVHYTGAELYGLLPPAVEMKWIIIQNHLYRVSSLSLFVFFITFIVAALRRSLRAQRAAERVPDTATSSD